MEFAPWGRAYNRPSPQATAFAHRSQHFLLEHETFTSPRAPAAARRAAHHWVTRSWATVHPWGSQRVYPNFPDPSLQDPGRAYYRDNYPRLREIKASYGPGAVFRSTRALLAH